MISRRHYIARSPLKRSAKPIRKVSDRKRKADAELREVVKVLREFTEDKCECRIDGICLGIGTDPHHKRKRSQGGTHELANLLWVCRKCHDWIEAHSVEAERLGWNITRKKGKLYDWQAK